MTAPDARSGWIARSANYLWALGNRPRWRRFRRALRDPGATQRRLLESYLTRNADTVFGRRHRFARIDSVATWQKRVPLSSYDDLEPLIERVRRGEPGVLTAEPVIRLVPSSGSTAARKLVPYTRGLLREIGDAVGPWIVDLYRKRPDLAGGRAYWSISPAVEIENTDAPEGRSAAKAAIPIGFDDDGAYLGGFFQRLVDRTLAVPNAVRHLHDVEAFRHATLVHLLGARDLTLISVWHPFFLTLLLEPLERRWDELLGDIAAGCLSLSGVAPELQGALTRSLRPDPRRAAELERLGPESPGALWPRLEMISCWADGHAAAPATALAEAFPGIDVEPKGLIATEAFVSLPFAGARPAAVCSHFLEFLDDDGRVHLLDQLADGGEYSVVVTTGGGLYRYRLRDRVGVEGRLGATPCLRFLARDDRVSDRAGEKLSEGHVAGVLARLLPPELDVRFAMLAPDEVVVQASRLQAAGGHAGRPGYTLYLESRRPLPAGLAAALDEVLAENLHYRHCVELGQLAPARVFRVAADAHHVYLERQRRSGKRLGDIKPTALSTEDGWSRHFEGRYQDSAERRKAS